MIDALLAQLFGEALFGRYTPSRRAQLLARLFFGLIGAALGIAGAAYMTLRPDGASPPMRLALALLFLSIGAFWLLNVGLARKWRWPGVLVAASLIALIAARFIFGP
jgi:hypothetical protein